MTAATVYEFVRQRRHGPEGAEVCSCDDCHREPWSRQAAEHREAHISFEEWLDDRFTVVAEPQR